VDVLAPVVPFRAVSIIDFSPGNRGTEEDGLEHRLMALQVVGRTSVKGENRRTDGQGGSLPPSSTRSTQSGPGPYPDKHDEGEWPANHCL